MDGLLAEIHVVLMHFRVYLEKLSEYNGRIVHNNTSEKAAQAFIKKINTLLIEIDRARAATPEAHGQMLRKIMHDFLNHPDQRERDLEDAMADFYSYLSRMAYEYTPDQDVLENWKKGL